MTTINPTPTQQETLEPPERIRVVVRAATSDDWIGVAYSKDYKGDPSTVHEYARAAVAGPRGDAESLVKKWIATLQDESRVTDEDAEDLTFRIIAFAATSSPAPAESDTCATCGGSREIVIGCAVGHPLTAPCPECSAKRTQIAGEQDAARWVKNKLRPEHKCKPLARAVMTEDRDWWIGELLEPVADWPNETHCLHMKTPLKDISFLCNSGDFEQLMVLSNVIVKLENLTWLRATTAGAKARLLPPFTKT